jgi:hypothetical protein
LDRGIAQHRRARHAGMNLVHARHLLTSSCISTRPWLDFFNQPSRAVLQHIHRPAAALLNPISPTRARTPLAGQLLQAGRRA